MKVVLLIYGIGLVISMIKSPIHRDNMTKEDYAYYIITAFLWPFMLIRYGFDSITGEMLATVGYIIFSLLLVIVCIWALHVSIFTIMPIDFAFGITGVIIASVILVFYFILLLREFK